MQLQGAVRRWKYRDHQRHFSELSLPFHRIRESFAVVPYNAETGRGSQRVQPSLWVNKLRTVIESGEYTPTSWSSTIPPHLQSHVQMEGDQFSFSTEEKLPLVDAGGRLAALELLLSQWEEKVRTAASTAERDQAQRNITDIENLPITLVLYLDGEPQIDFIRLQQGRPVDATLLFSLTVNNDGFDDPAYCTARDIAHELNSDPSGIFCGIIRMDARKTARNSKINLASLAARGPSDMATSLIGLARMGDRFGFSPKQLSRIVSLAADHLSKHSRLTSFRMPLTVPDAGATAGSASMLIGLGVILSYRMGINKLATPSPLLFNELLSAATRACSDPVRGTFTTGTKRQMMRELASAFFESEPVEMHLLVQDGATYAVPVDLCRLLSPGAFAMPRLPKLVAETVS
jgi:hypothetical protein